jgi:hypothetical protein
LTEKIKGSQDKLAIQEVGTALLGLQCMRSVDSNVLELVVALTEKIGERTERMSSDTMSNALHGLQNMSSAAQEVRTLLTVLLPAFQHSTEQMNAAQLDRALYGMRGMNSAHTEVRTILGILKEKIQTCTQKLSAQTISQAVNSLLHMSSDDAEVRELLVVLTSKMKDTTLKEDEGNEVHNSGRSGGHSNSSMDGQVIANALYGLQNMNSNSTEVLDLLVVLTSKMKNASIVGIRGVGGTGVGVGGIGGVPEDLTGQAIANALYGLQNMSSGCIDVQGLLVSIVERIEETPNLTAAQLSNALYGIIPLCSSPTPTDGKMIFMRLKNALSKCLLGDAIIVSPADQRTLLKTMLLFRHYCGHTLPVYDISSFIDGLKLKLQKDSMPDMLAAAVSSEKIERSFYKCIETLLSGRDTVLEFKMHIYDCFESDIIIKRRLMEGIDELCNIEINLTHHSYPTKQRYRRYRDEYLEKCGVKIVRFEVDSSMKLGERDVERMSIEALRRLNLFF